MSGNKMDSFSGIAETQDFHATTGRGRRWRRLLLPALMAVAAIGLIQWSRTGTDSAPQYKTETAQRGNLTVTVTATGKLEPDPRS